MTADWQPADMSARDAVLDALHWLRNPARPDVELRLLVEATHQRPPPSGVLAQEQDAFDRGAAHAEQFRVSCLVRQLFREIASLEDRGTLWLAGCATATPA